MVVIAEPIQRNQLRALARKIREMSKNSNVLYFPIIEFMEHLMYRYFDGFHLEIVPKNYFPPNIHAVTVLEKKVIRIREDIYHGAIRGVGRDRMTLAHEVGHYILLVIKGVNFHRSFEVKEIEAFRDPEWQAKAFAGELLCPYDLIKGMAPHQIAKACGVSLDAAQYHYKLKNSTARRFL